MTDLNQIGVGSPDSISEASTCAFFNLSHGFHPQGPKCSGQSSVLIKNGSLLQSDASGSAATQSVLSADHQRCYPRAYRCCTQGQESRGHGFDWHAGVKVSFRRQSSASASVDNAGGERISKIQNLLLNNLT